MSIQSFNSLEEANEWMVSLINESCVDNYRAAKLFDEAAMVEFDRIKSEGCCGSQDFEVLINGERWIIGCNFGH